MQQSNPSLAAVADQTNANQQEEEWIKDMRGWLIVLATLVATLTCQAARNPPGGFWHETVQPSATDQGHVAGTAILYDIDRSRYYTLLALNSGVFWLSVVIIFLLMSRTICSNQFNIRVLETLIVVDLLGMMMAYVAGSMTLPEGFTAVVASVVLLVALVKSVFLVCFVVGLMFRERQESWRCELACIV